jgi:hypothetical protein
VTRRVTVTRSLSQMSARCTCVMAAARLAAYKGRLRVRPAAQRVYINALRRARACGKSPTTWYVYTKYDTIIRYRALPGCVLLVLHTAKRVVTTGALPSAGSGDAPARHPSLRRAPHPHPTHPHARARTGSTRAAGWCAFSRVVLVKKYCIQVRV